MTYLMKQIDRPVLLPSQKRNERARENLFGGLMNRFLKHFFDQVV